MSEMLEKILSDENIRTACKRVYANKGAGGVDGVTVGELVEYMKANWSSIKAQIRERTYRPQPVLRVEIPKSNGGVRKFGIPTVNRMFDDKGRTNFLQVSFLTSSSSGREYSDALSYEYAYGHDSDSGTEVLTGLNVSYGGFDNELILSYQYDEYQRPYKKNAVSSGDFNWEIGYLYKTTSNQTTNQIQSYSSKVGNIEAEYIYGYDNAGNIPPCPLAVCRSLATAMTILDSRFVKITVS